MRDDTGSFLTALCTAGALLSAGVQLICAPASVVTALKSLASVFDEAPDAEMGYSIRSLMITRATGMLLVAAAFSAVFSLAQT